MSKLGLEKNRGNIAFGRCCPRKLQARRLGWQAWQSGVALLASITEEPGTRLAFAEIEERDCLINETHNQNTETQDCAYSLGKYQDGIRILRPCILLGDLGVENEPQTESLAMGMDKAENEARSF